MLPAILFLTITSAIVIASSNGRSVSQDNSGTFAVGLGVIVDDGVAEVVGLGEEEMSVDVEPSVKVIV